MPFSQDPVTGIWIFSSQGKYSQADHLSLKNWYPHHRVTNIPKTQGYVFPSMLFSQNVFIGIGEFFFSMNGSVKKNNFR